jgi:hypothetical protein
LKTQENVGRQGQFPHGIDNLTKCDYFAVGQIQNCYLDLSVYIASFEEYRQSIIDHLLEYKFNHWDISVRELTGQALFKLTSCCPDYMAFTILPKLLTYSFSTDLNTRHGALTCLAEIIHAICEEAKIRNEQSVSAELKRFFNTDTVNELKSMMSKIFDEKYFRGTSAEIMRPVVCFFIKKLSLSKLFQQDFKEGQVDNDQDHLFKLDDEFIKTSESFLNQCIEFFKENVQLAGVETVPYYCDLKYFKYKSNNLLNHDLIKESSLISSYLTNLKAATKEHIRSGYCLVLGYLPGYLLAVDDGLPTIIRTLIVSSKWHSGPIKQDALLKAETPSSADSGWVYARKDSIKAVTNLLKLVNGKDDFVLYKLNEELLLEMFDSYFHGIKDYSIDAKGDSGSRVREVSIEGIEKLIELCAKHDLKSITQNKSLLTTIFANIIQQSVERIDRTRSFAGRTFANLLYNKYLNIDDLEFAPKMRSIFKNGICAMMDWNVAYTTLPLFVKLLDISEFQTNLLAGLIYSIGSLTESLVKSATSSFLKQLQIESTNKENKAVFVEIINKVLGLCGTHLRNDRLSSSLVKAVDLIIQNGFLNDESLKSYNYPVQFLNLFLENVKVTKDMQKLFSYVDFFCDMLQFTEDRVRERSMIQLMIMLCHQVVIFF